MYIVLIVLPPHAVQEVVLILKSLHCLVNFSLHNTHGLAAVIVTYSKLYFKA